MKGKKIALTALFLGMVFLSIFTIQSIIKIQAYGQLINYVGIVRGATQRLVKLELADAPNDGLIIYLDEILDNLNTGHGSYGLVLPKDAAYQDNLHQLTQFWQALKERIAQARTDPAVFPLLLEESETYFDIANQTVFSAQEFSHGQTMTLMGLIICLFICILLLWALLFRRASQKILRLESSNKDLSDLAGRDTLTGAYTFEHFKSIAQLLLDTEPGEKYAIFYMDFEDFKYINDVFGYAYGDEILKNYARLIQDDLQRGETFGRVNADNFVAIKKYKDREEILPRQRRLDQEITEYMKSSYARHSLPICCGICCLDDVVENLKIEGLLNRANFARKTVKQGAYQNYAFYNESIRQRLMEENSIRSDLETAITNRELQVYYQPKVDLESGTAASAEALVRWRKADGTIVPPDQFIPILERDRNIAALDQYVFEEVCKWLCHMRAAQKALLPVSVNVSRLQFYNPDFVKIYTEIRDRYAIPAGLLEIEFTETIAFDNMPLLIKIVDSLKKAGFSCCIDDFGKGYSSLSLLQALPIDVLKIDRQFFVGLDPQQKDRVVVEGIVRIVRQLNIKTVAEGIETTDQVAFLKSIHCDYIQGYVFYRPMPQADYEALLEQSLAATAEAAVAGADKQ